MAATDPDREAVRVANDARDTYNLDDRTVEVLRDRLMGSDVFRHLHVAQQHAVALSDPSYDVAVPVEEPALAAADDLGDALDALLEREVGTARSIVALRDRLADGVDREVSWLDAARAYEAGYQGIDDLRGADQQELIEAGLARSTAARLTACVDAWGEA